MTDNPSDHEPDPAAIQPGPQEKESADSPASALSPAAAGQAEPGVSDTPGEAGSPRAVKKPGKNILKTFLDVAACRQVVTRLTSEREVKLQERLKTAGPGQFEPCRSIEQFRPASRCGARWEDAPDSSRFQICPKCRLHVYDFSKMDLAQASELVFTREGKKEPRFYRRLDGKFLTRDCPVGASRKASMIALMATVIVVFVGLVALVVSAPPPPKPARSSGAGQDSGSSTVQKQAQVPGLTGGAPAASSGSPGGHRTHVYQMNGNSVIEVDKPQASPAQHNETVGSPSLQSPPASPATPVPPRPTTDR